MSLMGFSEERKSRLAELDRKLEVARYCLAEKLAARIREIGFECIRCGECCNGEDNSVVVFPFEIRRIIAKTGYAWMDIANPPIVGEWDNQGNFHTLEWRIKKEGNSCRFYEGGCRIYDARPMLCRTYPFYLEDGILRVSECQGLGGKISVKESEELARDIIERHMTEIREAKDLLEKYEEFERGRHLNEGHLNEGTCIVHDSEGKHLIAFDHLPNFRHRRQKTGYSE
jgi:Fe-S-cluster containining protein